MPANRPSAEKRRHPKVPISGATSRPVSLLAERASARGCNVGPTQGAAQVLEDALVRTQEQ